MNARDPAPAGFLDTLRDLGTGLCGAVEERVELLSLELQEEKLRLVQIFVWTSAAVFTGMMAITFASLTLVYLFWDSARIAVLGGLTAFYAAALGGIIYVFRRRIVRQPPPFAATLQELREDRACIQQEN
jgi:uncharacterized membrane protein YqjE